MKNLRMSKHPEVLFYYCDELSVKIFLHLLQNLLIAHLLGGIEVDFQVFELWVSSRKTVL